MSYRGIIMIKVKVGGTYRDMVTRVKIVGKWKEAIRQYIKVAGQWRTYDFGTGYTPALGEAWAGGFVVGFRTFGGVKHALIASPVADQGLNIMFNNGVQLYAANLLDDGKSNTANLFDPRFLAAKYCRDYRGGGYSDWYLPAQYELTDAYAGQRTQFQATTYWTSTQTSKSNVKMVNMSNGTVGNSPVTSLRYIRPFRRVPIQ
jgi:hypothetical protein